MKKTTIFPLIVIVLLLVSCTPQVTVTSEVTVTSTPPPTETPMPTATATPVAVDGVADVDGTLYIFDETTQSWIALPALEAPYAKVIVDENNKVVALGTDGAEMYTLDMGTEKWVEAVTFEPMELTIDPNNMSVCTYEDVTSGRLSWSIKNSGVAFPEDSHNGGWENERGYSNSAPMYLSEDSKDGMQLVNLCKINNEFMGLSNDSSYVASKAVLNTDGTIGTIHFFLADKTELEWFLRIEGNDLGIVKNMPEEQAKRLWDHPKYDSFVRLYPTIGDKEIMRILNELQITGVVSEELSRIMVMPSKK